MKIEVYRSSNVKIQRQIQNTITWKVKVYGNVKRMKIKLYRISAIEIK